MLSEISAAMGRIENTNSTTVKIWLRETCNGELRTAVVNVYVPASLGSKDLCLDVVVGLEPQLEGAREAKRRFSGINWVRCDLQKGNREMGTAQLTVSESSKSGHFTWCHLFTPRRH